MSVTLSIIICSYNRAHFLDKNLPPLIAEILDAEEDENVEIILVDNNSTDHIADVAALMQQQFENLTLIKETQQGLSHARNTGWKNAKGEYVAYLDDDACIINGWLKSTLETLGTHQPLTAGGPVYPNFELTPPWWINPEDFRHMRDHPNGPLSDKQAKKGFCGGNMIFKRSVFEEIGGFDSSYGMKGNTIILGEEVELALRLYNKYGNKTWYDSGIAITHFEAAPKLTLAGYKNRALAAGISMHDIRKLDGENIIRRLFTALILLLGGPVLALTELITKQKPSTGILRFYQGIGFIRRFLAKSE